MLGTAQVVASVVVFEPELAFGCSEAGYLVLVVHGVLVVRVVPAVHFVLVARVALAGQHALE